MMETMTVKNLYDSFIRMTPSEQHDFISRINDYENQTVAHAADGRSLTCTQYREHELLRTAKSLTTFPNGYAKDEYASTPDLTVRFITKWNYKLDYIVQDDSSSSAIFHCSRNPFWSKDRF